MHEEKCKVLLEALDGAGAASHDKVQAMNAAKFRVFQVMGSDDKHSGVKKQIEISVATALALFHATLYEKLCEAIKRANGGNTKGLLTLLTGTDGASEMRQVGQQKCIVYKQLIS